MSEYRLWINITDLPFEAEERWEPLIGYLERRHADLGPVMTWDRSDSVVIVSLDSDSEAHAAQAGVAAVTDALHQTGLGDHYPRLVEVEKTLVEA